MSLLELLSKLSNERYFVRITTDSGSIYDGEITQILIESDSTGSLELRAIVDQRISTVFLSLTSIESVEYYDDKGKPPEHDAVIYIGE